jgi:predicted dehydrogenase
MLSWRAMQTLTALLLGSGFAAQGHCAALRSCGVEVTAMAARSPDVVKRVAGELGIAQAHSDWREALARHSPDLVAVGTPGGAHYEPILAALESGCHVYCDKPLSVDAVSAGALYRRARELDRKTAYAASFCYQPAVVHARRLVADGAIGDPLEAECVSHYDLNPLIPFGWSHRLDQGGGRLNNNFTHKLAIVLRVLGGTVEEAAGECRNDLLRVPKGPAVHDFRERERYAPSPDEARTGEWETVDSDWSYTVATRIRLEGGGVASAWFRHGGLQPRYGDDYVSFHGREGSLYIPGAYAQGTAHLKRRGESWRELPVPADILERLPDIENDAQRNWTALAAEFVKDVRGQEHEPYLTFRDGWVFQQVIDAVRVSAGWRPIEADPGP